MPAARRVQRVQEVPVKLKGQRDVHGTFSFQHLAMFASGFVESL